MISTVLAVTLIVVAGCQKEQMTQQSSNPNSKPNNLTALREGAECAEGVQLACTRIPEYTDMQHFEDVYNCLDESYEVHYDYECKVNAPYDKPKHKRHKKLKEIIFWVGQKHQYKSGDPHCYFSANTGSNTETL